MKSYLAHIKINLKLTLRDRLVLFFNYAFPLAFFFVFAGWLGAQSGGAIQQVVTMVLIIGVLGNGFFGAGIRAVQDRELNILRRFKVAPSSPLPMLVASMVNGWVHYIPAAALILACGHFLYGLAAPQRWLSLFVLLSVGIISFRSIGLIIASVVNSAQESQIIIQLFYLPMLFLSGATFPVTSLPGWVQVIAQFLPASHLFTGMQGILVRKEGLRENLSALTALVGTAAVATLLSVKLFRWEKEEKMRASAKLWLAVVLLPFLVLGGWQAYSRENIRKAKILTRDLRRNRTVLIRDARLFLGDGKVIESGAVLVKNGRIEEVFEGKAPDPKFLKADAIEASGKTLLPGLIDVHVHLAAPGGFPDKPQDYQPEKAMLRALSAYLYSGVTAVKSAGDPLNAVKKVRAAVESGERLGAELFLCGPMFTAAGGHGTEYFKILPEGLRAIAEQQTLRLPRTAQEARAMVDDLKRDGADSIKAVLEAGHAEMLFNRMDAALLRAVADEAHQQHLPIVIHTGDAADVHDAVSAGADGIEHGSFRERIPFELLQEMARRGIAYDPMLAVVEAYSQLAEGKPDPLERSLVQQVGPAALLDATRRFLQSRSAHIPDLGQRLAQGQENLRRAEQAGVLLVTGTDSGNPLVFHGPAIHRELQLWVEAGLPPAVALQAATYNAARLLRAGDRIGLIRKGHQATLLLVDGNPLHDITATERISMVLVQGERVDRPGLFEQQ